MSAVAAQATVRLYINCDDLTAIWERFPGLDPACPGGQVPGGVPVLSANSAAELGQRYVGLAGRVAGLTAPRLAALGTAWDGAGGTDDWAAVADVLAAGLGLGLAVLRQVAWRQPAVFGASFGGAQPRGGGRGRTENRGNPPFLRFEFLPGGGAAGLGLLASSRWRPAADALIQAAGGRDWAQTMQSYQGRASDMIAYGAAGSALRVAGVLVRSGVGLQPTAKLAVPVITRERMAAPGVAGAWRAFVSETAALVSAAREEIDDGLAHVFGGEYPRRAGGSAAGAAGTGGAATAGTISTARDADYLDAAYAVLADLIYTAWLREGSLAAGGGGMQQAKPARRLLPWGGQGPAVRALFLETPATIWQWLLEGCPDCSLTPGCGPRRVHL